MTNTFETAFASYAPILAAEFVSYHTRRIASLIETHGPELRRAKDVRRHTEPSLSFVRYDGDRVDSKAVGVKDEWLAKCAKEYGEQAIAAFVAKLTQKLGALSEVEVLWANGDRFTITGKLGSREIKVHQDRVFKVSTQGTPFHQWPARIYVDGKFTPEAKFKELAA